MSGSTACRGPTGLARRLVVVTMAGILVTFPGRASGASGPAERGVFWWNFALGYGSLTRHSAVDQGRTDTYVMDFLLGVPASSQVRCGVKLGGWLISPDSHTSGRAFSNYLAVVEVQPGSAWTPFLRLGGGISNYWANTPVTVHAWGWGGTVGLGWDLSARRKWLTPLMFEYSWGRPGDASRI